jgi:hypothetical protein
MAYISRPRVIIISVEVVLQLSLIKTSKFILYNIIIQYYGKNPSNVF